MDTSGAGERPEPVVLFRWPAWGVFFYAALMGFAGYGTILFGTLIYFRVADFGFVGFIMLVGTALIAFAVFLLGKSMRRWGLQRTLEKLHSRLRRGECLQCGYPMSLSAQEVGSECGWRHSHSLPIRTRSASEPPAQPEGRRGKRSLALRVLTEGALWGSVRTDRVLTEGALRDSVPTKGVQTDGVPRDRVLPEGLRDSPLMDKLPTGGVLTERAMLFQHPTGCDQQPSRHCGRSTR